MNTYQITLAVLSLLILVVGIERVISLYVVNKLDRSLPVYQELQAVGRRSHRSLEDFNRQLDEVMANYVSKVEARIGWLAALGNSMTFLALGGCFTKLLLAFGQRSNEADPEVRKQVLSTVFGESLLVCGCSVTVAIIALVMYAVFNNRANILVQKMGKVSCDVYCKVVDGKLGDI